jgi:hypothetical protein
MPNEKLACWIVDLDRLSDKFPTHRHEGAFWESLGRAVATFGFLEEVLGKAIFAFSATRPYNESEIEQAYSQWLLKLERALIDPLVNLIDAYAKAAREHPKAAVDNLDALLDNLRKAAKSKGSGVFRRRLRSKMSVTDSRQDFKSLV